MIQWVKDEQFELSKNFIKWERLKLIGEKLAERMDLARIDESIKLLLSKKKFFKN